MVFFMAVLVLVMAMVANSMSTVDTNTEAPNPVTTSRTYYWERCQGGKHSGPSGYRRLCDGDKHGECLGTKGEAVRSHDTESCAEACDDSEGCGGFEYDVHADDASCTLFTEVTGLNVSTKFHLTTHECYFKEPVKVYVCKSSVEFSGHYRKLCDLTSHGKCRGAQLGPLMFLDSPRLCADECNKNATCEGFEYAMRDESLDCYLFSDVQGAEKPDIHSESHSCFKKIDNSSTTTASAAASTAGSTKVDEDSPTSTTSAPSVNKASTASRESIMSVLAIMLMSIFTH